MEVQGPMFLNLPIQRAEQNAHHDRHTSKYLIRERKIERDYDDSLHVGLAAKWPKCQRRRHHPHLQLLEPPSLINTTTTSHIRHLNMAPPRPSGGKTAGGKTAIGSLGGRGIAGKGLGNSRFGTGKVGGAKRHR